MRPCSCSCSVTCRGSPLPLLLRLALGIWEARKGATAGRFLRRGPTKAPEWWRRACEQTGFLGASKISGGRGLWLIVPRAVKSLGSGV